MGVSGPGDSARLLTTDRTAYQRSFDIAIRGVFAIDSTFEAGAVESQFERVSVRSGGLKRHETE